MADLRVNSNGTLPMEMDEDGRPYLSPDVRTSLATGAASSPGDKGPTGDQGPKGEQGDKGERGDKGVAGDKGPDGDPGAQGPDGLPGPRGEAGPDGEPGADGQPGANGQPGADGQTGERGEKGLPGDKGAQGDPGTKGLDGDKGLTGDKGATGDKGPTGDAGPDGQAPALVHSTLANGATAMAFGTNDSVKVTPTANATYTTTVPVAGKRVTLIVLTSGTSSRTITFGSGFKPVGTLATGTTSARVFVVTFVSDGTNLYEASRTAAMVA